MTTIAVGHMGINLKLLQLLKENSSISQLPFLFSIQTDQMERGGFGVTCESMKSN